MGTVKPWGMIYFLKVSRESAFQTSDVYVGIEMIPYKLLYWYTRGNQLIMSLMTFRRNHVTKENVNFMLLIADHVDNTTFNNSACLED